MDSLPGSQKPLSTRIVQCSTLFNNQHFLHNLNFWLHLATVQYPWVQFPQLRVTTINSSRKRAQDEAAMKECISTRGNTEDRCSEITADKLLKEFYILHMLHMLRFATEAQSLKKLQSLFGENMKATGLNSELGTAENHTPYQHHQKASSCKTCNCKFGEALPFWTFFSHSLLLLELLAWSAMIEA